MTVSRSSTSVTEPGRAAHQLFQRRCARCHDEEGTGRGVRDTAPQIPDFRSHAWQRQRSDTELRVAILEGKGTRMPSFAGRINEQEARELVGRIRAFDPTAARRLAESSTDFDRRFRELQLELEDLKKQFREMNQESRKP